MLDQKVDTYVMFTRNCPKCQTLLTYGYKQTFTKATEKNSLCRSCTHTLRCEDPMVRKSLSERAAGMFGSRNSFYGKRHTNTTKDVIRVKARLNSTGIGNPMYGRSLQQVWETKYGKEEADKRTAEKKRKQSLASSGERNPMYGKPSPNGSGNGWSGWYRGHFFRSLRELSFMTTLDRFGLPWQSAETSDLSTSYMDPSGHVRTCRADFVVDGRYLVECKPRRLWNTPAVRAKVIALREKAALVKLTFKVIDPCVLRTEDITKMVTSGDVMFTARYQVKFLEWCQRSSVRSSETEACI